MIGKMWNIKVIYLAVVVLVLVLVGVLTLVGVLASLSLSIAFVVVFAVLGVVLPVPSKSSELTKVVVVSERSSVATEEVVSPAVLLGGSGDRESEGNNGKE